MAAAKIKLMIVDDISETRANLRKLLEFDDRIEIIAEAGNGEEAVQLAREITPDIVLMDINMPVMDGIQATERLTIDFPQIGIIILSVQGEHEYLRKAMAAGARDYLTKPPGSEELIRTIHRVYELEKKRRHSIAASKEQPRQPGRLISVFSTKGGVGKTTIAVNLAAALAQLPNKTTVVVDLDLQFGDVAMLLDLVPRRTISDLTGEPDQLDLKTLESYLMEHSCGLKVLPGPLRPEYAELVHGKHVESILKLLKQNYDYIIVDTSHAFDDITLSALDVSDTILVITTLDVPTIKNVKLGIEAMASLHYESAKIRLLLNRADSETGVSVHDLETSLKFPIAHTIPSDGKLVVVSGNKGVPFVISEPKAVVTEAINHLAQQLTETAAPPSSKTKTKEKTVASGWRGMIRR